MPDRHRTRRRTLCPDIPDLIDLAQGLRDSAMIANRARARVDDLLGKLLPDPTWKPRYPTAYGWLFVDPALDVFDVAGANEEGARLHMEAVARALHVRGFASVRLHHHSYRQMATCRCQEREL